MRAYFLIAVAILTVSNVKSLSAQDSDEVAESRAEAVSVFEAFSTNWLAVASYDVAIDYHSFYVRDDGKNGDLEFKMRLVADHQHSRFLFARIGTKEATTAGQPERQQILTAFFMDAKAGEVLFRTGSSEPARLSISSHEKDVNARLASSGFPDVRQTGSRPFPGSFWPHLSLRDHFTLGYGPSADLRITKHGETNTEIVWLYVLSSTSSQERRFSFDLKRYVPTRMVESLLFKDGRRIIEQTEDLEWTEIKGVQLPARIVAEKLIAESRDKARKKIPEYYEANFKWRIVNEVDRLSAIDSSRMSSIDALREWVSAETSSQND